MLKVSNMPSDLYEWLNNLGLSEQNSCYTNCFMSVIQSVSAENYSIEYVLCEIETEEGHVLDHAIIKIDGVYFDPTLEPLGRHMAVEYRAMREFSAEEIVKLMFREFNKEQVKEMIEGKRPFIALRQLSDGSYGFE